MSEDLKVDMCVIGAGAAGLSVAAGAAQLGASVVLLERGRMGGDCLNYGCVPSKALLAAADAAEQARRAPRFGIRLAAVRVDPAGVRAHVQGTIASIAPMDSVERFEGLGATVIQASARFVGPTDVEAGGRRIRARRIVIASGSAPFIPPVPGIAQIPYLTNETVFDLTELPSRFLILGGGPVGIELAQAYRRLGSEVVVVESGTMLAKEDPELVDGLRGRLLAEGIDLRERCRLQRLDPGSGGIVATLAGPGGEDRLEASHLLVAAGRRPVLDGLGLDAAGIAHGPQGLKVDSRLRTTNKKVYAVGDAAGGPQFTHLAAHHAGIVIKNALFRLPARLDLKALPRVTYTAPELAQVGMTEDEAKTRRGGFRLLRWSFAEIDRAQAEDTTSGHIKVVTTRRGRILGAGIVGPQAGELIQLWILAIQENLKIGAIAGMMAPYPTLGEINKKAAGSFFTSALFSERMRRLVRFLALFG